MAYKKITADDLEGVGVLGQPDVPGLSARDMQLAVEGIPREVIIPRFNRLVDEVTARDEKVDEAVAGSGISIYEHAVSGTVHRLTGSGSNGKLNATEDWKPGDTMTVNGYPAYLYNQLGENISGEEIFKTHVPVFFFAEFVEDRYNCFFKMGGGGSSGLTDEELAIATAATGSVLQGDTFYAGDETLKTGTMPNKAGALQQTAPMVVDDNNNRLIMPIPASAAGYYDGTSRIYGTFAGVANMIGLTADKIVEGVTILGITGTAKVIQRLGFADATKWTTFGENTIVRANADGTLTIQQNTTGTNNYSGATFEEAIDVTNLSSITVTLSETGGSIGGASNYHCYVTVFDQIYETHQGHTAILANGGEEVTGPGMYSIDVSDKTGVYYLYVQVGYTYQNYFTISGITMI